MSNPSLGAGNEFNGDLTLSTNAQHFHAVEQWSDLPIFWKEFAENGKPKSQSQGESKTGSTWNGALCAEETIPPNESAQVTFFISWRFPNRHTNFSQSERIVAKSEKYY